MKVIDLFAGCGGFSVGFTQAGFDIIKAVEYDPKIAATYNKNHPNTNVYVSDIGLIDNETYFKRNECDVIIGGPPCQGFSMAGPRIRNGFVGDPRNFLFKHYFNIVKIIKPKAFIIENVLGLLSMSRGALISEIIKLFSDSTNFGGDRYYLHYKIVNALDFGIPQHRERVIIVGLKNSDFNLDELFSRAKTSIEKKMPKYFSSVTVWDAISNIPSPTSNGEGKYPTPKTDYQNYLLCNTDILYNNNATHHSTRAIARMSKIKPGQNWTVLDEEIHSVHSGSYGRLSPNGFAPTITTRFDTPSGGMFIHPIENRTLTPREAARIQSFPDSFVFYGPRNSICKQIGNAVPPKIAFFLATLIKETTK